MHCFVFVKTGVFTNRSDGIIAYQLTFAHLIGTIRIRMNVTCNFSPNRPDFFIARRRQLFRQPDPIQRLRREPQSGDNAVDADTEESTEMEIKGRPSLCCASCLHPITSLDAKIEMSGRHEHLFTNPHGYQFLIGCFDKAPGCQNTGDWLREHTWFTGYLWRYSLCAACHTHLGWQFRNDVNHFFGLIKVRLVSYEQLH